ncbi:hypothetical protein [Paenibacillus antarcticus]|uniref:Uncharacterized protein n=1 Tax=Paenibacillus antarcticus TaxID=253703 RepID=A0A168PAG5_9BACL|nr:hypothetical protein [Paenibacillus antarcticus]OAB46566.1 hypothetical protein PBAT_11160 [Paenibacillus antarcticus]
MSVAENSMQSNYMDTDVSELVDFLRPREKKADSDYQGKYHYLSFNWRAYPVMSGEFTSALMFVLKDVDMEELKDFISQYIWRLLNSENKEQAISNLLEVAFGKG